MPFTPFHLGPSLAASVSVKRVFHIPAFLAGSILIDIEPLTIILLRLDQPLHGFFHTLLGGLLVSIPVSLLLFATRKPLTRLLSALKLEQSQSFPFILLGVFSGTSLHIFTDSIFHAELMPFFPFGYNPFYGVLTSNEIHIICLLSFVLAGIIYGVRLVIEHNKTRSDPDASGG